MVEVQKYVPTASALLSLQCGLELLSSLLLNAGFRVSYIFSLGACVYRFLMDHPEYMESGVSLSRFSFQVPKPLQENYVRKRSAPRLTGPVEPQQGT